MKTWHSAVRPASAGVAGPGVHTSQVRSWVKKFADDPQHAFPGQGQIKPEQVKMARLKREVTKLKAERGIKHTRCEIYSTARDL